MIKRGFSFVAAPGGLYLVAPQPNTYHDDNGGASQPGDVISITDAGNVEVRRPDDPRLGPWETCQRDGVAAVFTHPNGAVHVLVPADL